MFQSREAFSSFAVDDMAAARQFYGETLGMRVSDAYLGQLRLHIGSDKSILVYSKPDHTPASFTILNFPVADIDKAVDELTERGVAFERYDGLEMDDKGIHRNDDPPVSPTAWFKDPAGNVLSLIEE